ncbi:hypothetical protein L208DRAFT_1291241 [Tricholoma matsutake]|nr:hypothetical protein L208DRAFT_1291241 [Tricholoma matsutake 945]
MSNAPASQSDFDFWEFVNCGRCQLPFALGATVPFWLTECGHVVCNNHLNADQSCAQCGAQGVHLVPLQREVRLSQVEVAELVDSELIALAGCSDV